MLMHRSRERRLYSGRVRHWLRGCPSLGGGGIVSANSPLPKDRAELNRLMAEFLAKGGTITKCPPGVAYAYGWLNPRSAEYAHELARLALLETIRRPTNAKPAWSTPARAASKHPAGQ
jgi:hypothetical protein